jgi:hypothetical protein
MQFRVRYFSRVADGRDKNNERFNADETIGEGRQQFAE